MCTLNAKTFLEYSVSGVCENAIRFKSDFKTDCGRWLISVWIETILSHINMCN